MRPILPFISLFVLFLLLGCAAPSLGLKNAADCDTRTSSEGKTVDSDPKYMVTCLHEAAVSAAYGYKGQTMNDAQGNCIAIKGVSLPDAESIKKAQSDQCFYDIAIIAARNGYGDEAYAPGHVSADPRSLCLMIQEGDAGAILKGATATQNACIAQVERLRTNGPIAYQQNPQNLCSSAFVLFPLIGLGLYLSRR